MAKKSKTLRAQTLRPEGPPREYVCVTTIEYDDDVECFASLTELIANQYHDLLAETKTLEECMAKVKAKPRTVIRHIRIWFGERIDDSPSPTMTVYHPDLGELSGRDLSEALVDELAGNPWVALPS